MNVINTINDQPQLAPLNQLGQGLSQAHLTPLTSQANQSVSGAAAKIDTLIPPLIPQDEQQISFNPAAMQEAHTLSEDRVAKLLGLI